jgi:hypothetical protein
VSGFRRSSSCDDHSSHSCDVSRLLAVAITLLLTLSFSATLAAQDNAVEPTSNWYLQIHNIKKFLEQCPDRDTAWTKIKSDFDIRREGISIGSLGCTEPISSMPVAQYTDEIIVAQGLRVIYYMDRGQTGHLPWTQGTLYDWMKSKIGGLNLNAGGSWCCSSYNGKWYVNIGTQNDSNRDFDKQWRGIAGNIDLYAHETRHVDGFPHVSCCGITNGCDETFDPANLSPYGVQWWLNNVWLNGTINVGYGCGTPQDISNTNSWFLSGINSQYRSRFCSNAPALVAQPAVPGGRCPELMPRVHGVRR